MHRARRGAGFLDDFASGFKKGFSSVVAPFADVALKKIAGQGRGRRKLTGEAYRRACLNLAKARAARRKSSTAAVGMGYRKKLRSRATTRARQTRVGIRRHTQGAGFLDDLLGTVNSVAKTIAPIAVEGIARRYGHGRTRANPFARPRLTSMNSGYPAMVQGLGRARAHRGGSLKSTLLSAGKTIGKDYLLPAALSVGKNVTKNVLLPKLKERFPWLSSLGLGRRRRQAGAGLFLPGM